MSYLSLFVRSQTDRSADKLLIGVFLVLNGIVLVNACLHDPTVGYDAPAHLKYIEALRGLHLPSSEETPEFYSPPLPYLIPALWTRLDSIPVILGAKLFQIINVLLSCGLSLYLLKICELLRPSDRGLKVASLAMLGSLPVYYKTFAFVRGESFVAFFGVLVTYLAMLIFIKGRSTNCSVCELGVAMGLLILSRQLGFLLIFGMVCFVVLLGLKQPKEGVRYLKRLLSSLAVAALIGGWFYFHLWRDYGSLIAASRVPYPQWSLSHHPATFYFGLGQDKLFVDPVRREFDDQLIPIFYSEIWGDYWTYFVVYGKDLRTGKYIHGRPLAALVYNETPAAWLETNRFKVAPYLGRVNALALIPTMVILGALVLTLKELSRFAFRRDSTDEQAAWTLILFLIGASLSGYFWFLVRFDHDGVGDVIKASYILQIFPLLAIMGGNLLRRLREKSTLVFRLIAVLLMVAFVHNCPAMVTRYVRIPWVGIDRAGPQ